MTNSSNEDNLNTISAASEVESSHADERPLLLGRDRELAEVEAILKRRKSALVIVSAPTNMGKTSLLREINARALDQGWHTAHSDSEGKLSIEPATTERTFRERVLTQLDISTYEAFVPPMTSQSRLEPVQSLLDQVRRWERVLLIIDGYRPEPRFAYWFTNSFINEVKHAEAPVVVAVADQSGNLAELQPFADKVIDLGSLDPQAVKKHFESVGRQIAPPMDEAELDAYVNVACKDPAKLAVLTRVLRLAQPDDGSASPPSQRER